MWEIDQDTFLSIDALEGHPRWYKREKVSTDILKTRAWVYLMPESEIGARGAVDQNCWRPSDEEKEWLSELA